MGGSLNEDEIITFKNNLPFECKVIVETGTYRGESAKLLSKFFERVHTIELCEPLYHEAQRNNADCKNIDYYYGDSLKVLPFIAKDIPQGTNCAFFLDAHISGSDSSWNGTDMVPLLKEINIIQNHFTGNIALIIDDVRLFDQNDWSGITQKSILKLIHENAPQRSVKYYYENDRLYIVSEK